MDILDIIDKKEKGEKLTKEELQYVIDGYLDGTIKDYQMSALLTEIDLLGLKEEETINLTDIMLHSGEILDLGFDNIVDKHSTGGVGDKTTIVLAPLVASLGVKVAKMSGRGLGHTGGASGASSIVIDLKVGSGALVNNLDEAKELANLMVKIGHNNNKKTACVLTNMDEPLGYAVGNSIEVIEAINTLKGDGPKDLTDLVIKLGSLMVSMGLNISEEEAEEKVKENLYNGKGYEKMLEWVKAQGGDINNIPLAKHSKEIIAQTNGYISTINALEIGKLSRKLGAGRLTKDDEIDLTVGIILNHKVGEYFKKGETLATILYNEKEITDEEILSCYEFRSEKVENPKLIISTIK